MRRVVITGMGAMCAHGTHLDKIWQKVINGEGAFGTIRGFDASDLACQVAAEIPL
ncbi:MAG: beta-ketoacyl-ACP synthase II, partial [Alphaproteobacteria bacterium]|nr:beta-ketoacyl-ACP synthase II [Alphaproteobacteria bacterium]